MLRFTLACLTILHLGVPSLAQPLPEDQPLQVSAAFEEAGNRIEVDSFTSHSPGATRRALEWIKERLPKLNEPTSKKMIVLGLRETLPNSASDRDAFEAARALGAALDTGVIQEKTDPNDPLNVDANERGVEDLKGLMGKRYLVTLTLSRMIVSGTIAGTAVAIRPEYSWVGGLAAGVLAALSPGFFTAKGQQLREWLTAEKFAKLLGAKTGAVRRVLGKTEESLKWYFMAFTANGLFRTIQSLMAETNTLSFLQNAGDVAKISFMEFLSFAPWDSFFANYEKRNVLALKGIAGLTRKQRQLAEFYVHRRIDVANWAIGILTSSFVVGSMLH
ncbi:MAG: hypothetical protein ABL958_07720, partial [Bdellovibrionia bacterium]